MKEFNHTSREVGLWFNSEVLDDASWDDKIATLSQDELAQAIKEHFEKSSNPRKPVVTNTDEEVDWAHIARLLRIWMGVEGKAQ